MAPIVDNEEMQKAFLEYTKPPHTFQKLKKLSEYVSYSDVLPLQCIIDT